MGKLVLEIDYTKIQESINLFIGNNGTGKTSILKCHHPFAYNSATGDTANNGDLIIEGKDGEKIINIQNGQDIFYIKHIYTRKKDGSLSVKSFIEKNGVELNDNGTSTSFKEVVAEELGVDETFLTLLSIGNTVDGFVEFTSANRKNAASKLFSQLDIYEKYYKDMTALSRSMKTLLNNVASKLSRYSGVNKEDLVREYREIKRNINDLSMSHTATLQNIGAVQSQLDSMKSTIEDCEALQQQLSSAVDKINELRDKRKTTYTKKYIKETLVTKTNELAEVRKDTAVLGESITSALSMKDTKLQMVDAMEINLSKIVSNESEEDLLKLKAKLEADLSSANLDRVRVNLIGMTKNELITASIYLDQLSNLCNRLIYETVNESMIPIVLDKFRKNKNLDKVLSDKYNAVGDKLNRFSLIHASRLVMDKIEGDCSNADCPYRKFYEDYIHIINRSTQQTDAEIKQYKETLGGIQDMIDITNILKSIFDYLDKNKTYLENLPIDIFDKTRFIETYLSNRSVYDKDRLIECIDICERESQRESTMEQLKNVDKELARLKDSRELADSMKTSISELTSEIASIDKAITEYTDQIVELNGTRESLERDKSILDSEWEILSMIGDVESVIESITKELRTKSDAIDKIDGLRQRLSGYNDNLNKLNNQIGDLTLKSQKIANTISEMDSLEKEELDLKYKYDDIMEIRKAVSPTTGIPVEFIEFYVKSQMIHKVNTLLDSVYHGTLQIAGDLVVVDDKDFVIPYKKNNTIVSDISKASDGERAILSIAFSLALIQLTNENNNNSVFYTIMLLDEIDRPLDHGSRSKFIDLIETYMDVIHAEQLFLISHNNMFDSYPVHVMMTSEMNTSNMSQMTITRLYEGN